MLSLSLLCARLWSKQFAYINSVNSPQFHKATASEHNSIQGDSRTDLGEVTFPRSASPGCGAVWRGEHWPQSRGCPLPQVYARPLSLNTPSSPVCLQVIFPICYYSLYQQLPHRSQEMWERPPRQFQGSQEYERIPCKKALRNPVVNKCVYFTEHFSNSCHSRNVFFFISSISLA